MTGVQTCALPIYAIGSFVDERKPGGPRDAESALEALRRVRCCDPACRSGAYLPGMLHGLMGLRTCLFSSKSLDSILGVRPNDGDFALSIARFRLWLSLSAWLRQVKKHKLFCMSRMRLKSRTLRRLSTT